MRNSRHRRIWEIGVLFSPGSSSAADLLSGKDLYRAHYPSLDPYGFFYEEWLSTA